MARQPRHFVPNIPVHLIQRGNNRQVCFYAQRDYIVYLGKLLESSLAHNVAIHSFVLMTNHVHLLCTPHSKEGLSQMMQALGRYYVRFINSTYGRTGTLWEGRFKASMIDSDAYLLTVSRYIELNPVRANMVAHPAEYPWSSYRHNSAGKQMKLISPHDLYSRLGRNPEERQAAYRSLFSQQIPGYTLEEIRTAATKAWVLGDGNFKRQIERHLDCAIPPFPKGGDRKSPSYRSQNQTKIKVL